MNAKYQDLNHWIFIAIVCGFCANIAYFMATQINIAPSINRLLFFSFGPLLIVTSLGIYKTLSLNSNTIACQVGTLFLILSGVSHTIMATMQGSISANMIGLIEGTDLETQKEVLRLIYKGVFSTQSGVDMTFDIFISIGVVLIAFSMWKHPKFGKVTSLLGVLFAATGLLFNIIAFPENAGHIGLIDPSPLFGAWFLIVTIQMVFIYLNIKKNS